MKRVLRNVGDGLMLVFLALLGTIAVLIAWPVGALKKWLWHVRRQRQKP